MYDVSRANKTSFIPPPGLMTEYTENEDDLSLDNVFEEPPRPPTPPPTFTTYNRQAARLKSRSNVPEWSSIELQLVGHHVLWAQHLWNAAIVLANFLDDNSSDMCQDKTVLELGAGGALPSLVTALCGAHQVRHFRPPSKLGLRWPTQVVITDYPDTILLDNIIRNIDHNIPSRIRSRVKTQGYVWGTDPEKLFRCVDCTPLAGESSEDALVIKPDAFDVIILSDLIFNHSQHSALLDTCEVALQPARRLEEVPQSEMKSADPKKLSHEDRGSTITTPCVLVFFSHHRPQYAARDLNFFACAKDRGWICEQVVQTKMKVSCSASCFDFSEGISEIAWHSLVFSIRQAMFPDDPGDEDVRSTVHGWVLRRPASVAS
ncbi:unnamed protein product [Rhizoctonia solani]|uniref:Uncharacterized protein n=1 Tax=Rhizoctonia solani TaxID=456999 RepID=A0A8H3HAB2_9AGAM|nr:unnamed protein product [Rhizoctonia solani]